MTLAPVSLWFVVPGGANSGPVGLAGRGGAELETQRGAFFANHVESVRDSATGHVGSCIRH